MPASVYAVFLFSKQSVSLYLRRSAAKSATVTCHSSVPGSSSMGFLFPWALRIAASAKLSPRASS